MAKVKTALALASAELAGLFTALKGADRRRACAFEHKANRKLHRGGYRDVDQVRAEAEAALLTPQAIDKEGLLKFIQGLVDIMKQLLPLFIKA
jgi:hypothetical protein